MIRNKTRDEILAVAAGQFSRSGFKGTSLQDIAAAVGCSKATVLYHFDSKEAILAALVAPAAAEFVAFIEGLAALDDAAAQVAAIEGFADLVLRYRREVALIYDGSLATIQSPAFADLRPLTETLCLTIAGRSTEPADCIAAQVVLGGICSVVIQPEADQADDETLRAVLVAVAKRALITDTKD